MSDPLGGVSAATSASQAVSAGKASGHDSGSVGDRLGAMGKDTFMALLVAQLKYQNPMQPTDSMQFVNQLAMFSMIEQLQAMREDLDAMRNAVSGTAAQSQGAAPVNGSGSTSPTGGWR